MNGSQDLTNKGGAITNGIALILTIGHRVPKWQIWDISLWEAFLLDLSSLEAYLAPTIIAQHSN